MTPYYTDDAVTLYAGDCLDVLRELPDASVDAVVTDPPYLLGFMAREWDTKAAHEHLEWHGAWAAQALRVLKPGGHMLAFGGTRTWHRLACAVEDAGFEIRDSIAWLYGSGFPKSLDVSKAIDRAAGAERTEAVGRRGLAKWRDGAPAGDAMKDDGGIRQSWEKVDQLLAPATDAARQWQGWGTALKPAFEPIVVARKPLAGTVAQNVTTHGTGALNIDGCRVGRAEGDRTEYGRGRELPHANTTASLGRFEKVTPYTPNDSGRWPANVVLDETAAAELDQQVPNASYNRRGDFGLTDRNGQIYGGGAGLQVSGTVFGYGDSGGASRFFPVFRAERECILYGRLSVCHRVQESSPTSALTVAISSATSPGTTGDTVPANATMSSGDSTVRRAASAADLCGSCATAIAQSLALTAPELTMRALGLPSTRDYSERILTRSLAHCAADLASNGTTWTTADWTTLLGCVADAISAYITRASLRETRRSDRSSELPRWKYEPKAPTAERPRDGATAHPTVKPLDLMRWLVRLVCPPGGVVLDPFLGSGTTAEACVVEGFRCIGVERDPDYLRLAVARLSKPIAPVLFGEDTA